MAKSEQFRKFHDKYYKILLLIPAVLLVLSLAYIGVFYSQTGDFSKKDISLTGGTTVTVFDDIDPSEIEAELSGELTGLNARIISDIVTREQQAVVIETTSDGDLTRQVLEEYLGYTLDEENSSFEFTGSSLSESFYNQLLIAIAAAFVLMGIVVFILFRTFVPSTAVIISAFADIVMTLAVINLGGVALSTAGIVAFLMLIGYSVDTDILLTTRILKRSEGNLNERIGGAFKTGLTMTLTSLFAVLVAFFITISFSNTLSQIFLILSIGLCFDLLNTWITNTSILKWYMEKRK